MKISNIRIKNYRNLENINIKIDDMMILIGENNSGKTNLLKAITLPLLADELSLNDKKLGWIDINNNAKEKYYQYILENNSKIKSNHLELKDFENNIPTIEVELQFIPTEKELYYVKDLAYSTDENSILYGLKYKFKPTNSKDIYDYIKSILKNRFLDEHSIENMKMNLLPIDFYSYSITSINDNSIPFDTLKYLKYTTLHAERDDFSKTKGQLGSKVLVKLLHSVLTPEDKLEVESQYCTFFQQLKSINKIDKVFNWAELSNFKEASTFFKHIDILPNIPSLTTFLNSIRLGYSQADLAVQGLGHRNIILLLVLLNSLLIKKDGLAYNLLTLEEPEAHLCINNIKLMSSFLNAFPSKSSIIQLMYSTHSIEFINKMDLKYIVVIHDGKATSFYDELSQEDLDYLSKTPNLDLFKLFYSKKCILVEGLSEELLIRSYIDSKKELNDIEVISFHKGYTKIINIWKKINYNSNNKLGIIRDFDNQPLAKSKHDELNDDIKICIRTTNHNTLEPEILYTGDNFKILKSKYGSTLGWDNLDIDTISHQWCSSKAGIMLLICKGLKNGYLNSFKMPQHIEEVFNFMSDNKGE